MCFDLSIELPFAHVCVWQGAFCPDGDLFIPLPEAEDFTSEWEIIYSGPRSLDAIYRVKSCPPGYFMIRKESYPLEDECIQCEYGQYLLDQSNFSACLNCPVGAVCKGGSNIVADDGYWKEPDNFSKAVFDGSSTEIRRFMATTTSAVAPVWFSGPLSGFRRKGDSSDVSSNITVQHFPRLAKMHKCPPMSCAGENACLRNRFSSKHM